jgi:hypothetical protein
MIKNATREMLIKSNHWLLSEQAPHVANPSQANAMQRTIEQVHETLPDGALYGTHHAKVVVYQVA